MNLLVLQIEVLPMRYITNMENIDAKNKFVELRAKGNSFQSIADSLGVSKQTLINWSKELKMEISNLRTVEYDALLAKYKLNKQKKLELYGEFLEKVTSEIQKRSLEDLSTDKLFHLYLKINDSLEKDMPSLVLEGTSDWTISDLTTKWEA